MRRLTILFAAVGALMLLPAASAFAENQLTLTIGGTGSGEVSSVGGLNAVDPSAPPVYVGEPPIECSYASPGPQSGTCANEMEDLEEGIVSTALHAVPSPGSAFAGWRYEGGFTGFHFFESCQQQIGEGGFKPTRWQDCVAFSEPGGEDASVTAFFCLENEVLNEADECVPANLKINIEEGEGTVVSNPAGLECLSSVPRTCVALLAEGPFTLTASPAPGYLVKSWKGCDVGGVNGRQCTVTATSSLKTVGVKFYKVFSLEGSKSGGLGIMGTAPGGINCGYACTSSTALFKEGSLTVKAKPAKHFHFVEFTGGTNSAASCNGVTAESCTIASFNSNSAIEEVYAEDAKNVLTLSKTGGGQGFVKTKPTNINCGLTCTAAEAEFYASETPEVSVTLGKGTSKVTWTTGAGTCTGNALVCTVPMSEAHSLVAKFE